jgi:hypothetical protein
MKITFDFLRISYKCFSKQDIIFDEMYLKEKRFALV